MIFFRKGISTDLPVERHVDRTKFRSASGKPLFTGNEERTSGDTRAGAKAGALAVGEITPQSVSRTLAVLKAIRVVPDGVPA